MKATLNLFLRKVNQLNGYGDMDTYRLVKEFKQLTNASELVFLQLLKELSNPDTWSQGKEHFIQEITNKIPKE
ncbi:hypothetical protein [Pedobacter sp. MW01-1-1]|uniref:hypothetical protein n=1 Tax=Pedobacter sp. MW01-1-1 TaxID=3383027 RepID=UPI003FF112B2